MEGKIMLKKRNLTNRVCNLPAPMITEQLAASQLGRRSFLKRIGFGGTALLPAAGWLASGSLAKADITGGGLTRSDAAILRFLAAAEILETDLWQQYNELALGNAAFQQAL